MVNTSLHLQHVQQSQAAMLQAPPAVLRTNLVVVTGHPTWYAPTPSQQVILANQQFNQIAGSFDPIASKLDQTTSKIDQIASNLAQIASTHMFV